MKRYLKIISIMMLIAGLCSLTITASAETDPEALKITEITVMQDGQNTILDMTFENNGSVAIDEFGLALAFIDGDGYRVFAYTNTLEGYANEVCNWYYTPDTSIAPGAIYQTEDIFSGYSYAAEIVVAIRYYHPVNSDYVLIPESQWQWVWPDYEWITPSYARSYYGTPSDAVYTASSNFYLGYSYYLLDDYNAFYYGKNQGGEWITSVEPNSPAAIAGLEAGDLILFIDGVKPTENLYAVDYGLSAIVSGEKVEWVYERDSVVYTTRIYP